MCKACSAQCSECTDYSTCTVCADINKNFNPTTSTCELAPPENSEEPEIPPEYIEDIDPVVLEKAEDTGSLSGTANKITSSTAQGLTILAWLLSFDHSGVMMKFSQMSKLFARFRLINMNYGYMLFGYFIENAKKHNKKSEKGKDYINANSNGTQGRFTHFEVPLDMFEHELIKMILYLTSFMVKIIAGYMLQKAKRTKKITAGVCKFISYQ